VAGRALLVMDKDNVRLETLCGKMEMLRRFANGDTFYDWLDYERAKGAATGREAV
jgi:hypothetical protein